MITRKNIFPQYYHEIDCKGKFPYLLEESYKIKSKYQNSSPAQQKNLIYASENNNILNEVPSLFPLNSFIQNVIFNIYQKKINIISSWVNFSYKYSFQEFHVHSTDLVGVYYIDIPPKSGNLTVYNKADIKQSSAISPYSGLMIICDGNQPHSVEQNFNDTPRIALPFNINFTE